MGAHGRSGKWVGGELPVTAPRGGVRVERLWWGFLGDSGGKRNGQSSEFKDREKCVAHVQETC